MNLCAKPHRREFAGNRGAPGRHIGNPNPRWNPLMVAASSSQSNIYDFRTCHSCPRLEVPIGWIAHALKDDAKPPPLNDRLKIISDFLSAAGADKLRAAVGRNPALGALTVSQSCGILRVWPT